MTPFKSYLKIKYKSFIQLIFKFFYGSVKVASSDEIKKVLTVKHAEIKKNIYKTYRVKNCRLFTTSVHDQSIIANNKLIEGPSFQLRVKKNDKLFARNNGNINENITLKIGTPRILKKLKGKVFSLLSGGAAKNNYYHWLFEVLPMLKILSTTEKIENIDYFLLPSTKMNYQLETFNLLNIPHKKLLDSNSYKHIICEELYVVDHPYRLTNNTVYDKDNMPLWIFEWVRKNFLKFKSTKFFGDKIFIDRSKSISLHRDLKNKDEVYKIFKDKDYNFIRPENFGLRDQISIFFSAKKIAGLHGAAFANICFCSPKAEIIEFKTSTTGMEIANVALKHNLDYKGIVCEATNRIGDQQGKLIVPIEELKKYI